MGSKLWLAFSAAALPVMLLVGALLEWQAREALETELARRVTSIAVSVGSAIPSDTWSFLFALVPGEEESRTAVRLRNRLQQIAADVEAERIAVWSSDGRLWLDTAVRLPLGSVPPRAALLDRELEIVQANQTAHTPLFTSDSGTLVMIGLAPIVFPVRGVSPSLGEVDSEELVQGVLLVEIPSVSLSAVTIMRQTLILTVIGGLFLVLVVALILARSLSRRISLLTSAAQLIGRGDLNTKVPPLGTDEIGSLAEELDGMRRAIQVREKQLRAMVGGVAHEIRNPLGGLTLYAEMLARDQELDDKQRSKAKRILEESLRLERTVADFLVYARPESPRQAAVAVYALLRDCAASAGAQARWSGDLELYSQDFTISCDPDHSQQIILNLVINAMQAAGSAGKIRLSAVREGDQILITIEDSGPGIPANNIEQVYEPFYTEKADGAGLGLAITKRLCDLGNIDIHIGQSELGGALFRLTCRAANTV